ELPVVDSQAHQVGFVVIEIFAARRLLGFPGPVCGVVVAVEMDLVGGIAELRAIEQFFLDANLSGLSSAPTCSSCSIMRARTTSSSARPSSTAIWIYFGFGCDQMWMAVELNQTKNGLSPFPLASIHFNVSSSTSLSIVSMRLRVSGPVSSIF